MRFVLSVALVGLVACVGCGSSKLPHPQEKAIAAIEALGGYVSVDKNGAAWAVGFGDTKDTDAVLIHLKGLTKLSHLHLDSTKVTDAGLVHLNELTNLELLDLYQTKITDAGLEHLKGLTNLEKLDLTDTNVTDVGIKKLQKALPNCAMGNGSITPTR